MNQKHIIAVCALALCTALCIVGASALTGGKAQPSTGEGEDVLDCSLGLPPGQTLPHQREYFGFNAQYLRTNGYQKDVAYPVVKIIRSVEELNEYYEANRDSYDMRSFRDACEKYDEAYFRDRILVMVLVEAGSGSVRYQVTDAALNGETLVVDIDVIAPEAGTCDMAEWHILIEPAAGVNVVDEAQVNVNLRVTGNTARSAPLPQIVSYVKDGGSITLHLPQGWEYQVDESVDDFGSAGFVLSFRPEGFDSGRIAVYYFAKDHSFGVCGTGLAEETVTVGPYEAWQGTYDGRQVWDFIVLKDVPQGQYVILNQGAEAWWKDYGDEAMEILNTLTVSGTALTEEQAVEIAREVVTVEYDHAKAVFDGNTATWTVDFAMENTAGGDQAVTLDSYGNILGSVYGE